MISRTFASIVGLGRALDSQSGCNVVAHVEPGEGGGLLEHEGDALLLGVGRFAVDQHRALRRLQDAGKHVEQRRLAATRRAADADELVSGDGELHMLVHDQVAVAMRGVDLDFGSRVHLALAVHLCRPLRGSPASASGTDISR